MHWINVAQDTEKWWAVVSLVMNLLFHKISSLADDITSLSEELCTVQQGSLFLFPLGSATKTISFAFWCNIVVYLECILDLWCTQRMHWCTNMRCPQTEWKHEYWVLEYIHFAQIFCARSRWLSLINSLPLCAILVTIYCDSDEESNYTWLYMKIT